MLSLELNFYLPYNSFSRRSLHRKISLVFSLLQNCWNWNSSIGSCRTISSFFWKNSGTSLKWETWNFFEIRLTTFECVSGSVSVSWKLWTETSVECWMSWSLGDLWEACKMEELKDLVEFCHIGCFPIENACGWRPERGETASLEESNVLLFSLERIWDCVIPCVRDVSVSISGWMSWMFWMTGTFCLTETKWAVWIIGEGLGGSATQLPCSL